MPFRTRIILSLNDPSLPSKIRVRTSAIAFQNQNNFFPAKKFSLPSASKLRKAETKLWTPAGYSSRQLRKSFGVCLPAGYFLGQAWVVLRLVGAAGYSSRQSRKSFKKKFMMLIKINPKNPDRKIIQKAAEIIKKGGLVIFPTDTVYGLLADARNEKVVEKIFKIKKRPKNKPLAIFIKDLKTAKKYAFFNEKQEKFLKKNWPGKTTVILKSKNPALRDPAKRDNLAKGLMAKNKTIGLRIPDCKLINSLLEKINFPLAQTSANISGGEATTKIREVLEQFADKRITPDLIIDAGDLPQNKPSKIVDLTKEKSQIIRF